MEKMQEKERRRELIDGNCPRVNYAHSKCVHSLNEVNGLNERVAVTAAAKRGTKKFGIYI